MHPLELTRGGFIVICLLLSWALFAGACLDPSTQDDVIAPDPATQGSFGYRFEPEQQVARGRDDEPTVLPGVDSAAASPAPERDGDDLPAGSTGPSLAPIAPTDEVLGLQEPPAERVPGITPVPYPEEWLSPPPQRGFFESEERVIILLALIVVAVIAGIGVVRNW